MMLLSEHSDIVQESISLALPCLDLVTHFPSARLEADVIPFHSFPSYLANYPPDAIIPSTRE